MGHALALARFGSFRRAAREEHISQSAFSRSIRNLEEALGAQLFDRSGSQVTPTVFGEAVIRHAREVLGSTSALGRELDRLKGLESDSLRVALGTFPAELFAAGALGELARRLPELRCRAVVANFRNVAERVLREEDDLGVADIGNLDPRDRFLAEPIGSMEFVFFCRPGHPLLEQGAVSISDLESYPSAFTRFARRVKSFRPYNSVLEERTGDLLPHIEVEQFSVLLAVVTASNTLGGAAPIQIENEVRNGDLCVLPFRAAWMRLQFGTITLPGRVPNPAAILYKQLLQEFAAEACRRNEALVEEFLAGTSLQQKRF
jgi:DNA-binding transcriptional LysR family regulator